MSEQNADLIKRIKKGDTNTFNVVYKSYYFRLFAFAKSYLRDDYLAANIVQDAFMSLWEKRENLLTDTYLPSYLLTIVKNNSLNHLNHLKTRMKVEDNLQSSHLRELELRCLTLKACDPEQMFHSEVQSIVEKTLKSLPEQTRKTIHLSRFEGLSNKEIASKLNITVKGVEFHITKALKALRENLKDYLIVMFLMGFHFRFFL
jgi:RNA polymerase sigma-70 factor, ECF subfamily